MNRIVLVFLLLGGMCTGQTGSAVLLKADKDFARTVAGKGLDGWMEFMAENSVRLGSPPVVGKDAIRTAMANAFRPGFKLTWSPTHGELFKGGDLGYTVGRYEMTRRGDQGKTVITHGSYLTIWAKQKDGTWKVVWDGGSQDPAPEPAAKPKP